MTIDILGIKHNINEMHLIDNDAECLGMIDYKKQEISLRNDLMKDLRSVTLIHEILHGILEYTGNGELNKDEDLINRLSTAIYQVFKGKNELITYLFF